MKSLLLAALLAASAAQDAVDHVLVLQDNKDVVLEDALGVMAKHGVAADVARPLLVGVSETGQGIVVQGTKAACERIKASFKGIGMSSTVRPITAEDRKGPPSEYVGSDVLEIGVEELEELMASDAGCLVAFHGTTCSHCKAMAPDYKQVAAELNGSLTVAAVNLNALDRGAAQALADRLGIVALPTLRYVRSGNHLEYNGPRKFDDILKFAQTAIGKKAATEGAASEAGAETSEEVTESEGKAAEADAGAAPQESAEAPEAAQKEAADPKPASKIGQSKVHPAAQPQPEAGLEAAAAAPAA